MAFEIKEVEGTVAVIVSKEKCITTGKKGYDAYLKSFIGGEPDEGLLGLNGDPTRFVCKKALSWHQTKKMRKMNITIRGRKVEMDPNFTADMIRRHVVDIKNPAGVDPAKALTFSKDEDGLLATSIIEHLDRAGVLGDMITAIRNSTADEENEAQKKP